MNTDELKIDSGPYGRAYLVKDEIGKNGRHHKEYGYKEWYRTANGQEIEVKEWGKLYKAALIREGKQELFGAVLKHISERCMWLKTEEEREIYAAECISSEAYLCVQWKKNGFQYNET